MYNANAKLIKGLLMAVVLTLVFVILYLQIDISGSESTLVTVSLPQTIGGTGDLVAFSISPGSKISGKVVAIGRIQGGYFFEGNIMVKILDANKNLLKTGNGTATSDWMTVKPVAFTATVDVTGIPSGPGYIRLENDNPSGDPAKDKYIDIPVTFQ